MGIFFEDAPTDSQSVALEAGLQPYLHKALVSEPRSDDVARREAATAVDSLFAMDSLQDMPYSRQKRARVAVGEAVVAAYKSPSVPSDAAPILASSTARRLTEASKTKRIIWWRLLVATLVLAVVTAAAIWTEAAGLKTAPDELWKIASAGFGSVVGVLIGEKVS